MRYYEADNHDDDYTELMEAAARHDDTGDEFESVIDWLRDTPWIGSDDDICEGIKLLVDVLAARAAQRKETT